MSSLLRHFEHDHMPPGADREITARFHELAHRVSDGLKPGAEQVTALRKVLEGLDAARRAEPNLSSDGRSAFSASQDLPIKPVLAQGTVPFEPLGTSTSSLLLLPDPGPTVHLFGSGAATYGATAEVLNHVSDERQRQREQWGQQTLPDGTGPETTPLQAWEAQGPRGEHLTAEGWAASTRRIRENRASALVEWKDVLLEQVADALAEDPDSARLRNALVQVAAVAVSWAEDLDRRHAKSMEADVVPLTNDDGSTTQVRVRPTKDRAGNESWRFLAEADTRETHAMYLWLEKHLGSATQPDEPGPERPGVFIDPADGSWWLRHGYRPSQKIDSGDWVVLHRKRDVDPWKAAVYTNGFYQDHHAPVVELHAPMTDSGGRPTWQHVQGETGEIYRWLVQHIGQGSPFDQTLTPGAFIDPTDGTLVIRQPDGVTVAVGYGDWVVLHKNGTDWVARVHVDPGFRNLHNPRPTR